MEGSIHYGEFQICYSVSFSGRKTLGITVKPDGKVELNAPCGTTDAQIEQKVRKRAAWIMRQRQYFRSFGGKMPPRRFISGESHFYLGRQYLLHVSIGKLNSVHFRGRSFDIVHKPKSKACDLMNEWYRERAKIKFAEIAEPLIEHFGSYGVEPSGLYIQEMSNRWGSCTPSGKIILNTELIKAPKPCVEYVITHELCHLVHRNHNKDYYALLCKEMPDWKRWKDKLEIFMNQCCQI